eukprot:gene9538-12179_t
MSLARMLRSSAAPSLNLLENNFALGASPAGRILSSLLGVNSRGVTTSSSVLSDDISRTENSLSTEPARKYRQIDDKEMWHEAWMYEDKFGTESDPILVPSLEAERIIGVTDPEDDNLVVWGILREHEAPRQFIEGGEYYTLHTMPYVKKVPSGVQEGLKLDDI